MVRLVCGVGINDAGYVTQVKETVSYLDGKLKQKLVWICPFYQTWKSMIERGYSEKIKLERPTYKDVTVCEEWHLFSVFKSWMESQNWEGNQLDKDLLIPGNKVYNQETCVFVSRQVNLFLTDSTAARGEYKIGVSWNKKNSKFVVRCNNPFTCEGEYLGYFLQEDEAHQAWLTRKLEYAHALATLQTDERVAKALINRYTNYGSLL